MMQYNFYRVRLTIFMGVVFLLLAGCGSKHATESYLRDDVDPGFVQRIAVLPFENNSADGYAANRARELSITQVLALGLFDTVDKGLVDSVLAEEALQQGAPIDALSLKRLGQRLNVQAFLLGSVDQAQENRLGAVSFPEIALTLRLIESNSGMILWQASGHRRGDSWIGRLLGIVPEDSYQVTLHLIRDLLATAPASAFKP